MRCKESRLSLAGLTLLCLLTSAYSQKFEQPVRTWVNRAESLTDDLVYDASRMDRFDRALMWARLGDIWWPSDPERARKYFQRAVEVVELSLENDKSSLACRLATARLVLGIVTTRDKELYERLLAIIGARKEEQTDEQRRENARALADAALSIVKSDPSSAEKLGEASLGLGFSVRLAQLLWELRRSDPESADKLFMQTVQMAVATSDSNFFSMILAAAFQGPYSSEGYRRQVLSALSATIPSPNAPQSANPVICNLRIFLISLIPSFEALSPYQAERIRGALAFCRPPQTKNSERSNSESRDRPAPKTIDDFLKAASEATDAGDRDHYVLSAAGLAAKEKDFEQAVKILDSIDDEGRKRLADSWNSHRWDFASSLACENLKNNDPSAMARVIAATPSNLRAFVEMSLATTCSAVSDSARAIELIDAARKDIDKADPSGRAAWYLALVRLYVKFSPLAAPAVLSEAIEAINRGSKDKSEECGSIESVNHVLTHQLLLKQFKLPASLLENDEEAIRSAIASIRPTDKRAAVRLQLLAGAFEENRRAPQRQQQRGPASTQQIKRRPIRKWQNNPPITGVATTVQETLLNHPRNHALQIMRFRHAQQHGMIA